MFTEILIYKQKQLEKPCLQSAAKHMQFSPYVSVQFFVDYGFSKNASQNLLSVQNLVRDFKCTKILK